LRKPMTDIDSLLKFKRAHLFFCSPAAAMQPGKEEKQGINEYLFHKYEQV
jgi:hypothetical protein